MESLNRRTAARSHEADNEIECGFIGVADMVDNRAWVDDLPVHIAESQRACGGPIAGSILAIR
jgi:hypothetical protein